MVQLTEAFAGLSPREVTLYYTTDSQLSHSPVLVFHGASTTTNSTNNSSRIQVHILTAAGLQSYPRLTIAPSSPFYAAVDHLPREKQGDEICRGLAFGLLHYFKQLPDVTKSALIVQSAYSKTKRPGSAPTLFGEQHAADLAANMVKVDNIEDVIQDVEAAFKTQFINHVDVDLVLPPGSISPMKQNLEDIQDDVLKDPVLQQYGDYAPLVRQFGEVTFLPTSKLRRAPSRPSTLGRSKSFLKDQKLSLRRQMSELVDTEERYVIKMQELVSTVAVEFRSKAKTKTFGSSSPSEQDLLRLFPKSLDQILEVNTTFLSAIQQVMDDTEEEAMQDLEADVVNYSSSRYGGTGRQKDPTGAVAFAKILLEWFPKFSDCYQDYIRASQDFPQLITGFSKQQSSFSQRVQQTGEQRLRSAIIEPVQRLPRYSLFIDNIVNYLPLLHPAMAPMLKARDIITAICSLDPPEEDKSQVVRRLKNLIEGWPSSLHPKGRLVSAVDFTELTAPYHMPIAGQSSRSGVLLLFSDCVAILRKARGSNLSARGILAEVDKPSAAVIMAPVTAAAGGQKYHYELVFHGWHALGDVRFTESLESRILWMLSSAELKDAGIGRDRTPPSATVRGFVLQNSYEGKTSKWIDEVTKSRVEGRFSEAERETDKWCLRHSNWKDPGLSMYAAVFEEGIDTLIEGRKEPASIRVVVDHEKGTKGAPVGHYGVDIVANISTNTGGVSKLEVAGINGKLYVDEVTPENLMTILTKRVGDLLKAQHNPGNIALASALLSFNSKILKSLHVALETDRTKSYRSTSPLKSLSNFLGGGSYYPTSSPKTSRAPMLNTIPNLAPPLQRSHSEADTKNKGSMTSSLRMNFEEAQAVNPLVRLEETFCAYVAALQSRKGNVVGKVLRGRAAADELAVSELYNTYVENPFDTRAAVEVSVDVLFVAFEKFLRLAWKDQMGPVVSLIILQAMQDKATTLFPGDFADYVKLALGDMAPQNRRAFIAIISLLADLLDGCGNDGDRGALTASFAELLVIEGDPHAFITLLDRMVEDIDRVFDETETETEPEPVTSNYGTHSSKASSWSSRHATNTGSLTSNASSLRRRFGLDTLKRHNSKDSDSKSSVWRTLSKSTKNNNGDNSAHSSISKGTINRPRSVNPEAMLGFISQRPNSRERQTVLGAFDDRPSSAHSQEVFRLSTIRASPPVESSKPAPNTLKKKLRRSSLSDLKSLMETTQLTENPSPVVAPLTIRRLPDPSQLPRPPSPDRTIRATTAPRGHSPSKILADRSLNMSSNSLFNKKENFPTIPQSPQRPGSLTERNQNVMSPPSPARPSPFRKGHSKTTSLSHIPTLRGSRDRADSIPSPSPSLRPGTSAGGLSSRQSASTSTTKDKKLKLQSPIRLRERLQNEAKAINAAEEGLQWELKRIGEEMARLSGGHSSSYTVTSSSSKSTSEKLATVSEKVKALESRIPLAIRELNARNDAVKADLETSLVASETKVAALEQLYKEAAAENELLYERFNTELGKIVKALRGKGRDEGIALVEKIRDMGEENARVKRENVALRREILGLRAGEVE